MSHIGFPLSRALFLLFFVLAFFASTATCGSSGCRSYEATVTIIYDGSIDEDDVTKQIEKAFHALESKISKDSSISDLEIKDVHVTSDSSTSSSMSIAASTTSRGQVQPAGTGVGGSAMIGVAGMLALVLLAVLLVRRQKRRRKLDDDDDGDGDEALNSNKPSVREIVAMDNNNNLVLVREASFADHTTEGDSSLSDSYNDGNYSNNGEEVFYDDDNNTLNNILGGYNNNTKNKNNRRQRQQQRTLFDEDEYAPKDEGFEIELNF